MATTKSSKRIKAPSQAHVPADRDACAAQIRRIGDLQRQLTRMQADMNDQVAAITDRFAPLLAEAGELIKGLSAGVQTWCEANRDDLTSGGKVKFHDFTTGQVTWRAAPPSVRITNAEAVIKTLRMIGLAEFIRTKEEIDKEAILANYSAAPKITPAQITGETDADKQAVLIRTVQVNEMLQGLAGIRVESGKEAFSVEPVELGAEEPA